MKAISLTAMILIAAAAFGARPYAQNYPWCAYYNTGDGSGTNCGFVTREQCLVTVSGIGGYCARNNMYVQPRGPKSRRHLAD
jgi:hypothetical protein